MTGFAKAMLAVVVLEVAFFGTLIVNALRLYGLDAFLPVAHAFGLGLFPWPAWAQWLVLAALCAWPLASLVLLVLVAKWPDGVTV